ncbi:hypothetical protein ACH5RR_032621 [Cinchona calisaya]|uniref:Uncharacterized protein n=1 Tax=Cinchona calisaya TaxID=153742 RepID=A0ABD2YIK7_9GENT
MTGSLAVRRRSPSHHNLFAKRTKGTIWSDSNGNFQNLLSDSQKHLHQECQMQGLFYMLKFPNLATNFSNCLNWQTYIKQDESNLHISLAPLGWSILPLSIWMIELM